MGLTLATAPVAPTNTKVSSIETATMLKYAVLLYENDIL